MVCQNSSSGWGSLEESIFSFTYLSPLVLAHSFQLNIQYLYLSLSLSLSVSLSLSLKGRLVYNDHTCHFRPIKSYVFVQVLRKPLERAAGIFFATLAAHRRDCVPSKMLGQPQNSQHGGMAAWHLMNGLGKGF